MTNPSPQIQQEDETHWCKAEWPDLLPTFQWLERLRMDAVVGKSACSRCNSLAADVNALTEQIKVYVHQAKSDQLTKQQLQERINELTEDKQRAAIVQCNSDYVK